MKQCGLKRFGGANRAGLCGTVGLRSTTLPRNYLLSIQEDTREFFKMMDYESSKYLSDLETPLFVFISKYLHHESSSSMLSKHTNHPHWTRSPPDTRVKQVINPTHLNSQLQRYLKKKTKPPKPSPSHPIPQNFQTPPPPLRHSLLLNFLPRPPANIHLRIPPIPDIPPPLLIPRSR